MTISTHPAEIKKAITSQSVLDEFEQHRQYLGMSSIGKCPRHLYNEYINGRGEPSQRTLQYCHEGYLHEWDILDRLNKAGYRVGFSATKLVAPFDERHQGHIDGIVIDAELLLEIKSVNKYGFDQIRSAPNPAHVDQVQAYLHYIGTAANDYISRNYQINKALIVYKNRENGDLWTHVVHVDHRHGAKLEQKARQILAAIDAGTPPQCECGRCEL